MDIQGNRMPTTTSYPPIVQASIAKMDDTQKLTFEAEYANRRKSKGLIVALAIIFPIQLFLLGKVGMGVFFWLTFGGIGVWYLIEVFISAKRTDAYNEEMAVNLARDLKIMA